jgi:hypothetical protein
MEHSPIEEVKFRFGNYENIGVAKIIVIIKPITKQNIKFLHCYMVLKRFKQ